jgi:hypothetical protein
MMMLNLGVYNRKNWKKTWKLKDRGCMLVFLLKIPKEFVSFTLPPPSYSWWVEHLTRCILLENQSVSEKGMEVAGNQESPVMKFPTV